MAKRTNEAEQNQEQNNQQQSQTTSSLPSYLEAALRLPSSYPVGAKTLDAEKVRSWLDTAMIAGTVTVEADEIITGGIVFSYLPTYGVSDSSSSPLTRACNQQFNEIRKQISGTRPYQPVDHLIERIAVLSLRALYATAKRIYGILTQFSATNLYRPRAILTAMGYSYDDYMLNAPALYHWLQVHQNALVPYPTVPLGDMDIYHEDMNTFIYTDGDIDASQMYIFNQAYYYSYEIVDEAKGLVPRKLGSHFNDLVELWDRMYTALQNSTDVHIISSDIMRAFPDSYINTLTAPEPGYQVEFKKFEPILESVMNAMIHTPSLGFDVGGAALAFRVYDDPVNNIPKCTPNLEIDLGPVEGREIALFPVPRAHINCIEADPSASTISNATRFMTTGTLSVEGTSGTYSITSMGTEVLVDAKLFVLNPQTVHGVQVLDFSSGMMLDVSTDHYAETFNIIGQLSNCDWHPPVTILFGDSIVNDYTILNTIEDIQNYIPISDEQVKMINEAKLLAYFGF